MIASAALTIEVQFFLRDVLPANEKASAEVMVLADFAQLIEDLDGQLACGSDDQGAQSVQLSPT